MPEGAGRPTTKKKNYKPGSMIDYDKSATRMIGKNYSEFEPFRKRERVSGTEDMPVTKTDNKNMGIRSMKRTQVTPGKWSTKG